MIIKKAKYKQVRVWQRRCVSSEVYGCDNCKTEIKEYPNEPLRLDMTVWPDKNHSETEHYHFCSWQCVLKFIPKIKSTYFASLPNLMFDEQGRKTASELIKIIKKLLPKQNYK